MWYCSHGWSDKAKKGMRGFILTNITDKPKTTAGALVNM